MKTIDLKTVSVEVIKNLPGNSTIEDIMYEINLAAQVLEGLKDEEEKKVVTTKELLVKLLRTRECLHS